MSHPDAPAVDPLHPLFNPRGLSRQIKSYGQDTAAPAVAVAPAARSFCALLMAIGVPDEDLDGVKDTLMEMEPELGVPTDFKAVASQVRQAWARYNERKIDTIDGL